MLMVQDIKGHFEQMLGQADATAKLPDPISEWCMVLVRPGYEQDARDSLRRRGIGAWWPNFSKEIGAKDRETGKRFRRRIFVSVLPGVLLSPARFSDRFWHAVDHAPGVVSVARKFNADVVLLSDLDIVLIHKIEQGLNRTEPPKSQHSYQAGDKVRFIDDDLRRFPSGEVIECMKDGQIKVEVNMFGRMTPWTIASWQVEPVDRSERIGAKVKSTDARERPAKSPSGRKAG